MMANEMPHKFRIVRPAAVAGLSEQFYTDCRRRLAQASQIIGSAMSQAPVAESSVALPPETREGTAMALAHEHHTYARECLRLLPETDASEASEYHLIDLMSGVSQGGFDTLTGARQSAREKGLPAWDIFHGNLRVEYHDPR